MIACACWENSAGVDRLGRMKFPILSIVVDSIQISKIVLLSWRRLLREIRNNRRHRCEFSTLRVALAKRPGRAAAGVGASWTDRDEKPEPYRPQPQDDEQGAGPSRDLPGQGGQPVDQPSEGRKEHGKYQGQ